MLSNSSVPCVEGKGKERKGKERKGKERNGVDTVSDDEDDMYGTS